MKKILWCFFNRTTNYDKNESLTALVYKCIWLIENCPKVTVELTQYYVTITTSSSKIELWNENKFHAWLCRGKVNGRAFDKISPSVQSMYDFKKCLENKGYDIFVKPPKELSMVKIDDVKC